MAYFLHEQLLIFFCLSLSLCLFLFLLNILFSLNFIYRSRVALNFSSIQKVRCFFSTTILIVYCVLAKFFILFLLSFYAFLIFLFSIHDAQSFWPIYKSDTPGASSFLNCVYLSSAFCFVFLVEWISNLTLRRERKKRGIWRRPAPRI